MSAFEELLIKHIRDICRQTGKPARTIALSVRVCIPERTVRYWLVRAERGGYIERVGVKRGWVA